MAESESIKETIREKYGSLSGEDGCCNSGSCCGDDELMNFADNYENVEGYQTDADLGLGCGIPTRFAGIQAGETVIDLGSGAGNDAFIALQETGDTGFVIGVDMTPQMVEKARANAAKLGAQNVEFRLGEIENTPIEANTADLVLSNCVMNLVPDKGKAFSEVYRILKPGGRFSISDIVHEGELPDSLLKDAEAYAGCVSGSLPRQELLDLIHSIGFEQVEVPAQKEVPLPEKLVNKHFSNRETSVDLNGRLISVTLTAHKPTS